jgi:23S rRNA (cytosine1962-C5)-methyltransferase
VSVRDRRGRRLGWALWSPRSEISLRVIDRDPAARIDAGWWHRQLGVAIARRAPLAATATGYRLIYGEADGLPGLICDRYDKWLVVQLLHAAIDGLRDTLVAALAELTGAAGILARNEVASRRREGLPEIVERLAGDVPREIEIREGPVRYLAAPWDGQKTGAFLDQRECRTLVGTLVRSGGRALDCFAYHGSFALHLAQRSATVVALDTSAVALERGARNAALNGLTHIAFEEADAFAYLKAADRARERFDTVVLDPPAFAKTRGALPAAIRGYKEINLRGMRLLAPGGLLYTASCSHHLPQAEFLALLRDAASDSGRRLMLRAVLGQPSDHPEVLTIPETGYLKGALIEALD